ncbi:MAG: response regulator [Anaerolineae bacterium]|nr:response regulator [Anaerolineae bacterium]
MEARIVVIDNDESMRNLFTGALQREDYEVLTYPYANISLVALEQDPPDLIILDFNARDEVIGWEFLQFLKMEDATAHIPVIITTTAFQLATEMKDYLFTRYIQTVHKPFDLDMFLVLVQKTLTESSQSGEILSGDRTLPILMVDDSEDLRDTFMTILRLEGYRVLSADNGLVALNSVSQADYRLILLDIEMPIMNGFEFLRAYELQLRPHAPVIIVSGEENIRSRVLPSFVVDVLRKPFIISELLSRVGKFAQPM